MPGPRDDPWLVRTVPKVGLEVTVVSRDNDVISGRVTFSSPDKFCVTNPCGAFWIFSDGWRVIGKTNPPHLGR